MGTRDKHDIQATMVRIKAKVENLMAQLETSLGTDPVPMLSLRRRLSKKTHGTQQNPLILCPACQDHHTGMDPDGKTFYKN